MWGAIATIGILANLGTPCPGGTATPVDSVLDATAAIRSWMHGATRDHEEDAIVSTLAHLSPPTRATVLRELDLAGDKYDRDHLVFDDVDDPARRRVLLHLIAETAPYQTELAVISDVDDTVFALFAPPPDPRHRNAFYWRAEGDVRGDVHYVTGRPKLFVHGLIPRLARDGMPRGTLELGSLRRILLHGRGGVAKEKLEDIERILLLYPAQQFVLVGDDRDRDPEVYREIQRRHPGRIAAVFIRSAGGTPRDTTAYPGQTFFTTFDAETLSASP